MAENVIRIPPNQYIHVLDNNLNTSRLEVGPQTFIRKEHESIVENPVKMTTLPPRTYCRITNPIARDDKGQPILNNFGEVEVQQGEFEFRTAEEYSDPFPLYPGEKLEGKIENLLIVQQNTALRLVAVRDFSDGKTQRTAGEEWQQTGPFTYLPRIEEEIVTQVKAQVIKQNTALKLQADRAFVDRKKIARKAGEQWLIRENGSYLPDTYEQVVQVIKGDILIDRQCLHLRALGEFVDVYGTKRFAGQEWLVTSKKAQVHIRDVQEEIIGLENAITLSSRQYCVVVNPFDVDKGQNQWGTKVLYQGEKTFFLQPGESLQDGCVQNVQILSEEEALLLQATEDLKEKDQFHKAGDKWIIKGPREYIPPVEVKILDKRKVIPLDTNEGIYVRDQRTGAVREVKGKTYLLEAHETLWEKHLPLAVEELVQRAAEGSAYIPPKTDAQGKLSYDQAPSKSNYKRDKTRIINFKAPHNSVIQLYDYRLKQQRVIFGPGLVMLGPDEQFTVLSLSGGKPKKENIIQTLQLSLGPDFMTDQIFVETSDHAKLDLILSYNWHFEVDKEDSVQAAKLFAVKDFVGDACKNIASRVRGAVSSITFEDFHNNSSLKIKEAVFGRDKDTNQFKTELRFPSNNLVISSVDIQGQQITDEKTRKQLAQSINLAIEISSKGQEMNSRHQAGKIEQEAKGQLERQKYQDMAKAEETKIKLLEQKAESARVKAEGEAVAIANAECVQTKIQGEAEVNRVTLQCQAMVIEQQTELDQMRQEQEAQVKHTKALDDLEIYKARELSDIEVKKFQQIIKAIGKETIVAMAKAGPETKAKLLGGLGLKGYLVTDGKNPINLFNTANGFLGGQ